MSLSSSYALGPSQYGTYSYARFDKDHVVSFRSTRDLNSNGTRMRQDVSKTDGGERIASIEINKPDAYEMSPKGRWSVALRNVADKTNSGAKPKPTIELDARAPHDSPSLHLDASAVHGKVLGDGWFGGISFSLDANERYVAYVACSKEKVKKGYFDSTAGAGTGAGAGAGAGEDNLADAGVLGSKFEYEADWGEKYVGVKGTTIAVLDTFTGRILEVPGLDSGRDCTGSSTVGQPVWQKDPSSSANTDKERYVLAYTKWNRGPSPPPPPSSSPSPEGGQQEGRDLWKLGMIYCYQRPCSVHTVDLTEWLQEQEQGEGDNNPQQGQEAAAGVAIHHRCMTPSLVNARSPRFSPDGQVLVFVGRGERLHSHNGCFGLYMVTMADGRLHTLLDVVHTPHTSTASKAGDGKYKGFPGYFGDQFPRNCFVSAPSPPPSRSYAAEYSFVCNSMWGSRDAPIRVSFNVEVNFDGGGGATATKQGETKIQAIRILSSAVGEGGERERERDGEEVCLNESSGAVILDASMPTSSSNGNGGAVVLFQVSSPCEPQSLVAARFEVPSDPGDNYNPQYLHSGGNENQHHRHHYHHPVAMHVMGGNRPSDHNSSGNSSGSSNVSKQQQVPTQIHYQNCPAIGARTPHSSGSAPQLRQGLKEMRHEVRTHKPSADTANSEILFESILLLPPAARGFQAGVDAKLPVLLVPHGGPHSCMPTSFVPSYAYLSLSLGAAIVHVNYRGSTGFGQASIDSLCGTIGTNDVSDMMTALTDTLAAYPDMLDADKVCVVGGSHGGFLAGHLIGQHPDTFCAAALRNPVTNIPAMAGVTDIPDWCFVETLGPGASSYDFQRHNPANADVLAKMFACSPVAHIDKVKTPALLCIGAVDRRVPQSQGIEYYSLLKSRGVTSRMLLFPEDCHAIDKPCSEAEHFVAIAEWFQRYINK